MQTAPVKLEPIESVSEEFLKHYHGCFTNMLRWPQLDKLWLTLKEQKNTRWYLYSTNKPAPTVSSSHEELISYIDEVNIQLRQLHKYDYCGIVYADEPTAPNFIKIYHPKNLGASCGTSSNRPIPGWILSTLTPVDLVVEQDKANTSNWNQFTQLMKFGQ